MLETIVGFPYKTRPIHGPASWPNLALNLCVARANYVLSGNGVAFENLSHVTFCELYKFGADGVVTLS